MAEQRIERWEVAVHEALIAIECKTNAGQVVWRWQQARVVEKTDAGVYCKVKKAG